MLGRALDKFFSHDAAGGILLMLSAIAAMVIANSSLTDAYHGALGSYLSVTLNGEGLTKPLILWINDGLMAIFFFLVGLEIKREVLAGELSSFDKAALPIIAALGGMAVPGLVYYFINSGSPETLVGWAIPTATDIAFALGILALVGSRAPLALKVFLLAVAIIDDLAELMQETCDELEEILDLEKTETTHQIEY